MTTRDYELLDQAPSELEQVIRQYPDTVKSLYDNVLTAMLGWLQGKDGDVYDICVNEIWRRRESGYVSLDERIGNVDYAEDSLKRRTAGWGLGPAEAAVPNAASITRFDVAPDFDRLTVELKIQAPDIAAQTIDLDDDNATRLGLAIIESARRLNRFDDEDADADTAEVHGTVLHLVPRDV